VVAEMLIALQIISLGLNYVLSLILKVILRVLKSRALRLSSEKELLIGSQSAINIKRRNHFSLTSSLFFLHKKKEFLSKFLPLCP